jgi:hypothetical protein
VSFDSAPNVAAQADGRDGHGQIADIAADGAVLGEHAAAGFAALQVLLDQVALFGGRFAVEEV